MIETCSQESSDLPSTPWHRFPGDTMILTCEGNVSISHQRSKARRSHTQAVMVVQPVQPAVTTLSPRFTPAGTKFCTEFYPVRRPPSVFRRHCAIAFAIIISVSRAQDLWLISEL